MAFYEPVAGLVIRYSYLWRSEHAQGREDGIKDRPCAVILVKRTVAGDKVVTVLPITHRLPGDKRAAIEIPPLTKRRLGLDDDRYWIVLNEASQFVWPGPDLRPQKGRGLSSAAYGLLPARLVEQIRQRLVALLKEQQFAAVPRTEKARRSASELWRRSASHRDLPRRAG